MRVHQLLSGVGPVDAVTNQARAWRRQFTAWGWTGEDYASLRSPGTEADFAPLHKLHAAPDDVLVLHYSAYAPALDFFLSAPQRRVVVSHNITPAHWFWDVEPITAVQCTIGREQLPQFAQAADLAIGVSEYNATELRAAGAKATAVVPNLVEPGRLGAPRDRDASGSLELLFVGRITPHKRHDLLVRLLALLGDRGARMTFVGMPISPPYLEAVWTLARAAGVADALTIEQGIGTDALADRYRAADAFVCLSEHEGFCIPLLEAFHFGVPVVARAQGGVTEVAGDAALLVGPDEPLPVIAELVALAATDQELRSELRARGRARLSTYAPDRVTAALREALTSL